MTKPVEIVYAKESRGRWVWVTVESDPIRVQISATKQEGRGFTKISFRHDTVGRMSQVVPSMTRLEIAP
jgi:hypothetical protein